MTAARDSADRHDGVTRLPGDVGGRTTTEVAYFDCAHLELAEWLRDGLAEEDDPLDVSMGRWRTSSPGWRDVDEAIAALRPNTSPPAPISYSCTPRGRWTLLMNNSVLGTDPGLLPSFAARELGCRAIRACCVDDASDDPARILEVYGPDGEPPLLHERAIVAADDGGRWVFEQSGRPHPFEEVAAYRSRLKRNRFTSDMMDRYLNQLGVPTRVEPRWSATALVHREPS